MVNVLFEWANLVCATILHNPLLWSNAKPAETLSSLPVLHSNEVVII